MNENVRILIVEDAITDAELAEREIRGAVKDCVFQRVETRKDYLKALDAFQPDIILSDYKLPHFNGMKALELALERAPQTPLIIWTGSLSEDVAVDCMKAGANNYIIKENLQRLGPAVLHALEERRLFLERKEAEEKYQAIFENSPVGIFQSTPQGRFISVNPAMARIYGYGSPQEMIDSVSDIATQIYPEPEDRNVFTDLFSTHETVVDFEWKNLRKDGSIFWTSTSARIVRDEDGNILYYEGFLQDITDHKMAEEKVRNREEHFRALIRNGRDNISLLDKDGVLLWESPAAVHMLGYAMNEFNGRNIFELMHPDDLKWTRTLFGRLVQEPGDRQDGIFRLRHSDGTWRWVEATATNMLDNPSVQAIIINYRDITDRKQAEDAVRESEERFSKAFNLGPAALSISHLDGGIFLAVNEAYLDLYGYEDADVVGHTPLELNMFPDENERASFMDLLHEQKGFRDREFRTMTKSGEMRNVICSGEPVELGGENYMLTFTTDITERKRAEMERETLSEIMLGLANTYDLQEFLRHLHASISKVIYAENLFIVYYHKDTGLFEEIYAVDQYDPPASPSKLEKSITSYVFRTGEPLIMTHSFFNELVARGEVELVGADSPSWLGAPLKTPDGTIGVIVVQDYETLNRYSERDRDFLASIASQVALVIERMQVEMAEREQRALAEALRDTSETLSSTLDYGQVLDRILAAVGQVVPHDVATIMLIENGSAHVVRSRGYKERGFDAEVMEIELSLTETTNLKQMFDTGQPVLITNTKADPKWKKLPATDWLNSNVGAPISIYGEVIGFILLDSETVDFFTPIHAERLKTFANQAAVAIHNAQLLQQAQNEIAERVQAEDKLRHSHALLNATLESTADGILVVGADRKISGFNRKFLELWHIPYDLAAELDDQVLLDYVLKQLTDPDIFLAKVEELYRSPMAVSSDELEFLDGRVFERYSQPLQLDDKNIGRVWSFRDITTRKQSEQELRTSEERFRQLAENIQEAFWMNDPVSGKDMYMSPAIEKIWGRSIQDMMRGPETFMESILPEDRDKVSQVIAQQRNGERTEMEYRITRPDGTVRWVWDRAFPIFDETGKVSRVTGIIADVTERKLADEALRESQIRFAGVVNSAMDAIISVDSDLRIALFNPAAEKMFRCDASDALGQPIERFIPERFRAAHQKDIINFGKTGITNRAMGHLGALSGLRSDGTEFPIEASISHIEVGGQHLYTVILRDITERKQSEEALRQSEERYRQLLNVAPVGVGVHIQGKLVFVNEAAARIVGADSPQALLGVPVMNFVHPDEREETVAVLQRMLKGEAGLYPREERFVRLDGSTISVEVVAVPLTFFGKPAVQVIIQDITERKESEREIERHLAEMQAVYENGLALGQLLEPHEIGDRIIETFADHLSWHHVTIRLLKRKNPDELELVAYSLPHLKDEEKKQVEQNFARHVTRVGEGVSGWVVQTGETIRTGNVHEYPQYTRTYEDIQSGLYMPLKIGERVIGVISVESEEPDAFSAQDERLLATLANQAVIAFENARLYESIQDERQRFANLFENSPVATWLEDFSEVISWMDGLRSQGVTNLRNHLAENPDELQRATGLIRILDVNHAAVLANGARNKQELVEQIHNLLNDATLGKVMTREFEMLWNGHTTIEFEMSSKRLDGSTITGIQRLFIPVNNGGRPDYGNVILTSTDISERVKMEQALRTSETHYRELADSITDVFFELNQELRYTHWNKASEALTGVSARDAMGKRMREVFGDSEEQIRIGNIYEDVLVSHQPKTFETRLPVNNEQRSFEINAYPSTRGVAVVAKDVTERKRSEILLQKRYELMEYAAEHPLQEVMQKIIDEISDLTASEIGFFHFVEEDQNTLGVEAWSTNALRTFHVPLSEGTHRPMDQAGVWAEALRQRRPIIHNDYEVLQGRKGLPQGHVQIRRELVIPILRNEIVVAVMGIANKATGYTQQDLETAERFADYAWDITERKQMEMALADERNQLAKRVEERTAELARALRVKDEFLANMSHELRTPLNAILGLSESLAEQVAGPLNEKQLKYLNTISESGHHLLALINDILDLAKIEAGQITLDINKVDINTVCQASLRLVKQLAQKKNLDISLEIEPGFGLFWADERRLKQMLVNLLSNAVKFTPENGRIGLEVRGFQAENRVEFTVWDNGIGINENDLPRLFKSFVQLDSGLARESTGTGLGLALVAQMAQLHGGSVTAMSEPNKGSRFTITLPWEPASIVVDAVQRLRNTGQLGMKKTNLRNRKTILLVEDTTEVIMMLKDYLESIDYNVATAQDGIDGIAEAVRSHPDLILMDIQMPRMDGIEATKKLRSMPDFQYTPIIALTALAMPNDRQRCLEAGMNEYISKPVNLRTLARIIQNSLAPAEETKPR